MDWLIAALCGAVGGLLVSLIDMGGDLRGWRQARREARDTQHALPRLTAYVDFPADSITAVWRLSIGAIAGGIFAPQLAGVLAAIAVGASAPALLRQLGQARTVQEAVTHPAQHKEPVEQDEGMKGRKPQSAVKAADGSEAA